MIYIGLSGWGDHTSLYNNRNERNKLVVYSSYFPIVEVDNAFYAIQPIKNSQKWIQDTPSTFQFIVKAYRGMTLHLRNKIPFASWKEMFDRFKESLEPYIEEKRLAMVLFQFPPSFTCTKENVRYLRWCKSQMGNIPCALEFRHQSWFARHLRDSTLKFMKEEGWIHSICDEPQAGPASIPTILEPTTADKTLVRFHGLNTYGWVKSKNENWRDVRYLYRYSDQELLEWKYKLLQLQQQTKDIYVVFNNNSGGDAANNAKRMVELLGISYDGLAPRQLDLFSDFD